MGVSRRCFLGFAVASAGLLADRRRSHASPASSPEVPALASPTGSGEAAPVQVGVLVDTTLCVGCRKCEEACYRRNRLPRPADGFDDPAALRRVRRPDANTFTVVNAYPGPPSRDRTGQADTFVKLQCMHCLEPACVSACIVGALTRSDEGVVVYDPAICIGCRYCLLACPFDILSYEFADPLAPRVRKCELCTDRTAGTGADPACVAACPMEALVTGPRAELQALAHERIAARPHIYESHLYGEHEAGGTAWLYLLGRPAGEVGLDALPEEPPAQLTETIQHTIYRHGIFPVALYAMLAGVMWLNNRHAAQDDTSPPTGAGGAGGAGGTGGTGGAAGSGGDEEHTPAMMPVATADPGVRS